MYDYVLKIDGFKKISPTKAKIIVDKNTEELCYCSPVQIQGVKMLRIRYHDTPCLILTINKEHWMLEENLISEMKIDLSDLMKKLGGRK